MRLLFGMLSCKACGPAVAQFADAVWPHTLLLHHDQRQASCEVRRDNLVRVAQPLATRWGDWSLVAATLLLLEQAVQRDDWSYFQLVSESCLPIRPLAEFTSYLERERPDAMLDRLPLAPHSALALMNHGWRYLPRPACLHRVLRRAGLWRLGPHAGYLQDGGLNLRLPCAAPLSAAARARRLAGRLIQEAALRPPLGAFPLGMARQCWVGGQWFGIARPAAVALLAARRAAPDVEAHFAACHIPDEAYVHTMLSNLGLARLAGGNHLTSWRAAGTGPDLLGPQEQDLLGASPRFFARKFSLDPACPLRRHVLHRVVPGGKAA